MVPTIRRALISIVSVLLNTKEMRRDVPIIDIREISANTEDRKENRYKEARVEATRPKSIKQRVCVTVLIDIVLRARVSNAPKAKALESIVPKNAAIRDTTRNEPSQWGNEVKTPPMNRLDGSILIPTNLKLRPRYAIDPATSTRRIKALVSPFFKARKSLLAKILWKLSGWASRLKNCNKANPTAKPSWLESKAVGIFFNVK